MSTTTESAEAITMTEAALAHVRRQLAKRGGGIGIRFGVKKVGCSGLAYVFDFVDAPGDDDYEFPVEDKVSVFVDPKSLPYVRGTKMDFRRKGLNDVFEFDNPNAEGACGCGESFSVREGIT